MPIDIVLIALDGKELIRGRINLENISDATILYRNGRYFTYVRFDNNGPGMAIAIYKERLQPITITEF